jgi:hypothetical protein
MTKTLSVKALAVSRVKASRGLREAKARRKGEETNMGE